MTSVGQAAEQGNGKILANFRGDTAACHPTVEKAVSLLREADREGLLLMRNTSEPVCEISVAPNKISMILLGGMNAVAAAEEAGIQADNHAMSTTIDYGDLIRFESLLNREK